MKFWERRTNRKFNYDVDRQKELLIRMSYSFMPRYSQYMSEIDIKKRQKNKRQRSLCETKSLAFLMEYIGGDGKGCQIVSSKGIFYRVRDLNLISSITRSTKMGIYVTIWNLT